MSSLRKRIDLAFLNKRATDTLLLDLLIEAISIVRNSGKTALGDVESFFPYIKHDSVKQAVKNWLRGCTPITVDKDFKCSLPAKVQSNKWKPELFRIENPFNQALTKKPAASTRKETSASDKLAKYLDGVIASGDQLAIRAARMAQSILEGTFEKNYADISQQSAMVDSLKNENRRVGKINQENHNKLKELNDVINERDNTIDGLNEKHAAICNEYEATIKALTMALDESRKSKAAKRKSLKLVG